MQHLVLDAQSPHILSKIVFVLLCHFYLLRPV
ncbi:hypothetical protein J2W32_003754 [Variovorax boronicumulans]|uniref:Uncharacterized protein n=1 Tax=Variovorax boronicumulans TaxID=436515 RepID=A0AAW8CX02_9BURK|nr:hypothetical protein [Variovorax boronicumulans]MDQ0038478.1 hypothetical protein [Variovorax boronicumulans]MDQ0044641.1 hypothetical protein [Variovorax boronicumulans]MDQ0054696.1 hypothetical protein [Variovorax boronicumulans]